MVAAITAGTAIAALGELVFAKLRPGDELVRSVADRLRYVESLLTCYAQACPADLTTAQQITRLAMVGTSRLRRILQRSDYSPHYREQMGALVALAGCLVDIGPTCSLSTSICLTTSGSESAAWRDVSPTSVLICSAERSHTPIHPTTAPAPRTLSHCFANWSAPYRRFPKSLRVPSR